MYDNPFTVLTAVAAPAVLTNACSVLALGTANRIARVVDRSRVVMTARAALDPSHPEYTGFSQQIDKLRIRGNLLLRALRLFYASLGMFAATALSAIVGSVLVAYEFGLAFHAAAAFGFIVGTLGVSGLVIGCTMMVRETRLAVESIAAEHALPSHIGR